MIDPVMYSFINKGLEMDGGKAIAQGQHAAVEAFRLTGENSNLTRLWYKGNGYKKVVLEGRDEAHMHTILTYLRERGFGCVPIIDEGFTDVPAHSFTAIGVELVDKNEPHAAATFSGFKLYRDDPIRPIPDTGRAKKRNCGLLFRRKG